ncbi:MAG: mandelate racemase/muconate lactonizing enzyme family protein [Pseudomonadota bacterium]
MIVRRCTVRLIQRAMDGEVWNPRVRWNEKRMLLVFVESGCGKVGVGEAWLTGGTPTAISAIVEDDLAPRLVGENPFRIAAALHDEVRRSVEISGRIGAVAAAWSAVETALLDLQAKLLDLPLCQLLGQVHEAVPVYASAGLYGQDKSPDDLAAEVERWVRQGFDAVKIKVAGAPLTEDVRRVAAVREAIGPTPKLMVDALYNCDVAGALALARALAPYDIAFLEAPVSPFDVEGLAALARQSPIPLCGNENMAWTHHFRRLVEQRAVSFVQFDVAACGGIREGRRIGELAHAFGLPCTLHAASTAVLYAASLHLAAALPNSHSVEYHMLHRWLWDLVPEDTFVVDHSRMRPPPGPGIGVALTPDDRFDARA